MNKALTIALTSILLLLGCKDKIKDSEFVTNISKIQADSLFGISTELNIIDVRTAEEFIEGHIDGASNIDVLDESFSSIISRLDTLNTHLVYCKRGSRSARAVKIMQEKGFKKIYNLENGYLDYVEK